MARVVTTVLAAQDLDDIWLHIALDNPAAADRVIDRIVAKTWLYADNPLSGRARSELADNVRSFPVETCVVFYEPVPDGIRVVRVLHGARDIEPEFEAHPL